MDVDGSREQYVAGFREMAHREVAELFVPSRIPGLAGGHLDRFAVEEEAASATAVTVFAFRGRRFHYERRIWPPDFPLPIKVSLYVEHLRERILLHRYQAGPDPEAVVRL